MAKLNSGTRIYGSATIDTTLSLGTSAIFSGSTSGTTTLLATATASTTTLTLPAATDTLVGKATTDTLTNKTLSAAVLTGTLTAGGGVGTNGQVLQSTSTGVQWATVSGVGTVTSVAATVPSFLSVTGSPITASGTLAIALASTPTNGQLLIGNGTGFSYATLTAGSNITITNSSGGITIASSGGGGGTSLPITKLQAQSFGGF